MDKKVKKWYNYRVRLNIKIMSAEHGGGGGTIIGHLAEAMNPIKPLEAAMDDAAYDPIMGVLGIAHPAFILPEMMNGLGGKKKSAGAASKPAVKSHGPAHH